MVLLLDLSASMIQVLVKGKSLQCANKDKGLPLFFSFRDALPDFIPILNHISLIGRKNHLKNDLGKLYSGQFLSCDTFALTFQMGSHTIMTSD